MSKKSIDLVGYYYQGLAGSLYYLLVIKDKNGDANTPKSSELISNNRFMLKFRTKKLLKKLLKEYLKVTDNKDSKYALYFDSAIRY